MRYQELYEDTQYLRVYHGGGGDFDYFDENKARSPNDYFGGGVAYFTDSETIARSYAKQAAKRSGEGVLYTVNLTITEPFDTDAIYTGPELKRLLPKNVEQFARGSGLLRAGVDKYRVLARLERGDMELTGEQVFKGLSDGMVKTTKARNTLKKKGYDSLRYTGGRNMGGEEHNVWLPYFSSQIQILEKTPL